MLGLNFVRGGFNPILWYLIFSVGFCKTSLLIPNNIPQASKSINDANLSLALHKKVPTTNPQQSQPENVAENETVNAPESGPEQLTMPLSFRDHVRQEPRTPRNSRAFQAQVPSLESDLESSRVEKQTPVIVEETSLKDAYLTLWIYLGVSLLILMCVALLVFIKTMTRTRLVTLHTNVSSSQNCIYTSRTQL